MIAQNRAASARLTPPRVGGNLIGPLRNPTDGFRSSWRRSRAGHYTLDIHGALSDDEEVIGGGWACRLAERVGLQIFGSQHVAAIGDLLSAEVNIQDVVGNFWSVGAGVVIR
jgi:hypothetical protein